MSSQKTSSQTATSTDEDTESTQSMAPVSRVAEPDASEETASDVGPQQDASAEPDTAAPDAAEPDTAASDAALPDAAQPERAQGSDGTADTEQTTSSVKDGAVKAAAAALAAARSAARKVQSSASAASASGQSAQESSPAVGGSAPPPPPAPDATGQAGARPEMHYSVGGVHGTAQQPPTGAQPAAPGEQGVRRVRLSVSRIDPWSIMKLAFLLSFAVGIMMVVATAVAWSLLNNMGTFALVQDFLVETLSNQAIDITQFVAFERVISLSMLIALVNMVLMTALATIMAILYNITAALVGGVHLALTDE